MNVDVPYTVRAGTVADAVGVAELLSELGYPVASDRFGARLERWLADPQRGLFVAAEGPALLGLASMTATPRLENEYAVAQLVALVVTSTARGRGIGRSLVAHVEAWAREAGCDAVVLTTARDRSAAHALYRGLGYRERDDLVVLTRRITRG